MVECDHLGHLKTRIIDDTDVNSAHRTQILCDHNVWVQISQRVSVQVVQILTPRQCRRHRRIDLSLSSDGKADVDTMRREHASGG